MNKKRDSKGSRKRRITSKSTLVDFLVVGGGPAGATAAKTLREHGAQGTIAIVSAEPRLPYARPALSKQFLLGQQNKDQLDIFTREDYERHNIELMLGVRAASIDPKRKTVHTEHSGDIRYGKLLIATGSRLKRLDIPGGDLKSVFYLRTLEDAEALRAAALRSKRAVVVGGSFIGLEVASSLTQMGLKVTMITREDMVFDRLRTPRISAFILDYFRQRGVDMLLGDTVQEFYGQGRIRGVNTKGGRKVPCDVAVVGIGIEPETACIAGSGIAFDDGIVVDQYMRTSRPDIYAAGDAVNFFDPTFGVRRRLEHWDNAVKQGRLAARNMLGQPQAYQEGSYFFSDLFDFTFEFIGKSDEADTFIERGTLKDKSYALFYLRDHMPKALFTMGRPPQETRAAESIIRHQVNLEKFEDRLSDPGFALETIPVHIVLVLQGGGAMGAFECGVVKALEEREIFPDIVAGVSIGSFNAVIIAGNPRHAGQALESFWNDLALDTPDLTDERLRRVVSSSYSLMFGSPRFFRPRWLIPSFDGLPSEWTSFYDPAPVKDLLKKYVDFPKLGSSSVRLLVNAVNVQTAELEIFDSHHDEITPEHILASGSLPPGFPWVKINGKYYWDGGIVSNSPLEQVIERCGATGKQVFIVDLYPNRKPLPKNLLGVLARRDEIIYAEKIRKDVNTYDKIRDVHSLIEEMLSTIDPVTAGQIKQRPHYIQVMGDMAPMTVTRIVNVGDGVDLQSKDYDFSRKSIDELMQKGYEMAVKALDG